MPGYFIVPASLSDYQLKEAVHQYNNDRLPIWSYTHTNKCSIIRCTPFREEAVQLKIDATIKNAINKTSPYGKPSKTFDLSELCPSIYQIEQSFKKFKSLNMCNGTSKEFDDSDNKYLSEVQSSKYYQHISTCLQVANNCVEHINNNRSNLLLQETNGVDFACLISSLAQIMLDPTKRTVKGVSEIIQREWIVNCHPFSTRLGILDQPVKQNTFNKFGSVNSYYTANSIMQAANQHHMNGKSPVYTLFLDCLYQILTQQPSKVEYSPFFLTSLLDGLYVPVFDSFVFNHERDRFTNLQRTQSQLQDTETSQQNDDNQAVNNHVIITGFVKQRHRVVETLPIWCWKHQYDCDVINMFKNTLYKWDEKLAKHNTSPDNQLPSNNNDVTASNDVTVKQVDTSSQKQGRSTFYVNNKNGGKNESREYRPIKCGASDVVKMHDQVFDVEDDAPPNNNNDVITLMTQQSQLSIWGEAYYRWNPHLQGCDCGSLPVVRRTTEIMNEINKLEDKITNLELVLRGDLDQLPSDDDVKNSIITSQSLSRYDVTSAYFPYIAQTLTRLKKSRKIGRVASIIHSKHRKRDSLTTSNHHNNQIVLTTTPPTDNNSTKRNTTYLSAV